MEHQQHLCNGGMLYHEVQESKLCAVHCVNTVLQGPFFSEFDLAALASDLDRSERQVLARDLGLEESHNVSLDGDFSIQVRDLLMFLVIFKTFVRSFSFNFRISLSRNHYFIKLCTLFFCKTCRGLLLGFCSFCLRKINISIEKWRIL